MTDLVLEDFEIKHLVSANKKLHYQRAGTVRAYWRRLGHDLIVDAYGYADVGETWHQRVRIVATLRWPNKIRRDDHNFYAYVLKPLVDGMVDARLIPDDNERHLVGPDVRRDPERGPHRIALRIEDAP